MVEIPLTKGNSGSIKKPKTIQRFLASLLIVRQKIMMIIEYLKNKLSGSGTGGRGRILSLRDPFHERLRAVLGNNTATAQCRTVP